MDHITDNIYISDQGNAADGGTLEQHNIVHVVTLCHDDHQYTSVHHPINDGANEQAAFDHAVDIVREAMEEDENVLVHCAAGISRSTTAVATALAAEREISFEEAVERVQENRSQANPHPELVKHAQTYLDS